jgi:hypothetical protein
MAELQLERDSRGRKVCKNSAMSDELKTQLDEFRDLARELEHFPISLHHIRRRRSSSGILGGRRSG